MYNGQVVKILLAAKKRKGAELSQHLYGTPRRTLTPITKPDSNPCASLVEKMAEFFEVTTDVFFTPEGTVPTAETLLGLYSAPSKKKLQQVADVEELLKKKDEQIHLLEERCKALEALNATYLKEKEMK